MNIELDGAQGEGGGQILRTALGLSLVTGTPFRIRNIRAGRRNPGLLRQHLTAVEAATAVSSATVEGADIGSRDLTFVPGPVRPGDYRFAVGTAGSATLVLQTVLPGLMLASGPSHLVLEGGTHNPFAPPLDFLSNSFLPLLGRMGPRVTAVLERPGFYPAGGGRFTVSIEPVSRLQPFEMLTRGPIVGRQVRILIPHLPMSVGERQAALIREALGWPTEEIVIETTPSSAGPGNIILARLESDGVCEVFAGFGSRDVASARVVAEVVDQVRAYLRTPAPVGEFLADQLMLPFALAGGGAYLAVKATRHAITNRGVIHQFLGERATIESSGSGCALFRFSGAV